MSPERVQAWIDVSRWLESILRKLTIFIVLPLIAISSVLNFGTPGFLEEVGAALFGLLIINAGFTLMRRLAESFRT